MGKKTKIVPISPELRNAQIVAKAVNKTETRWSQAPSKVSFTASPLKEKGQSKLKVVVGPLTHKVGVEQLYEIFSTFGEVNTRASINLTAKLLSMKRLWTSR